MRASILLNEIFHSEKRYKIKQIALIEANIAKPESLAIIQLEISTISMSPNPLQLNPPPAPTIYKNSSYNYQLNLESIL